MFDRTKRSNRRLVTMTAVAVLAMALPESALAIRGVKSVHFAEDDSACHSGQALPCLPDSGFGQSNRVYVHQIEVDGQWVFDHMSVPGIPDGNFWMAANIGGTCKAGYKIGSARISLGLAHYESYVHEVQLWDWPVGHPNAKHMPNKIVNVHVPFNEVFDGHPGTKLFNFQTMEEIFQYGEDKIAQRVAGGMTEEEARKEGFHVDDWVPMHGTIGCEGNAFGRWGYMARPDWNHLEIVYVGLGTVAELQPEEDPVPEPVDDVTLGAILTQAFLVVEQDAQDSCRLRLSGVFTSSEPMQVTYRFVNELGVPSQSFTAEIDQTQTTMIDHYYDLPVRERPSEGLGNVTTGGGDRGVGGLTTEETDREQGTFQIQVLAPHGYWSNIDGYNVEPCHEDLEAGLGGYRNPTRLPPGGFPPSTRGYAVR